MSTNISDDFLVLKNKIVSFGTSNDTLSMKVEKIIFLSDKAFIMGRIPKEGTQNNAGLEKVCAVSISDINDFIVFDNEMDYCEFMSKTH